MFGCDLYNCLEHIADDGSVDEGTFDTFDDVVKQTFFADGRYDFTKEVFSPFKVRAFMRHFDVFVMLRSAADSFPPSRVRVWNAYEHIWASLAITGEHDLKAITTHDKAYEAHAICTAALLEQAAKYKVPVIGFQDLMFSGELTLRAWLEPILTGHVSDLRAVVKEIVATRKVTPRYVLQT